MALAKEIVAAGFSPGQAKGIGGQIKTAISAAGTTQTTATELTTSLNLVSTCAASAGVRLLSCEIGDEQTVYNDNTGNALTIYPDVGSKINGLATNAGFLLGNNTKVRIERVTSTRWVALLSA